MSRSEKMMGNKYSTGKKTQQHKNRIALSRIMRNRFGAGWRDLEVGKNLLFILDRQ